ncbi:MAG: putative transcriptional regulator [Rhodoglobus sp.]|nr:putative transcriptional regulator [Rhodoglobus sp.]
MSQLCEASGVPVPSIKYYLREGLLPSGERTSANQVDYSDAHVERLHLIRALIDVGGLPVATAGRVLAAVDSPDLPLSYIFGVAQYAISDADLYDELEGPSDGTAIVDETIERMGWKVTDENPGRRGAARILDTYARLGRDELAAIPEGYAKGAELIARADLAAVATTSDVRDMAEIVVVGTVLGDGLVASLRRIAQEHVSNEMFANPRSES